MCLCVCQKFDNFEKYTSDTVKTTKQLAERQIRGKFNSCLFSYRRPWGSEASDEGKGVQYPAVNINTSQLAVIDTVLFKLVVLIPSAFFALLSRETICDDLKLFQRVLCDYALLNNETPIF